jgi:hypothetical protein
MNVLAELLINFSKHSLFKKSFYENLGSIGFGEERYSNNKNAQ